MSSVRTTSKNLVKKDNQLMVKVARLYFRYGETQQDIVKILKNEGDELSQSKVARLLRRAKDENIVDVKINPPKNTQMQDMLEKNLRERGIQEVIVVSGGSGKNEENLAEGGADVLFEKIGEIKGRIRIAISCGTTIDTLGSNFFQQLEPSDWSNFKLKDWEIFPSYLVDNDDFVIIHPLVQVAKFASELRRHISANDPGSIKAVFLSLPTNFYNFRNKEREEILQSLSIDKRMEEVRDSDIFLVGIGALNEYVDSMGQAFTKVMKRLDPNINKSRGKYVAESNFTPLDSDGKINQTIADKLIGVGINDLKKISQDPSKYVLAVAGGKDKCEAVRAALIEPHFNRLVTDETVAEYILTEEGWLP